MPFLLNDIKTATDVNKTGKKNKRCCLRLAPMILSTAFNERKSA